MSITGLIALSMVCGTIVIVVAIRTLFGPHRNGKGDKK
jgi:hypothetical protein